MFFIYFSCLIILCRISSTMLYSRHSNLLPELRKLSIFHQWVWCQLWVSINAFYCVEEVLSIPSFLSCVCVCVFYHERLLSNVFLYQFRWPCVFYLLCSINVLYCIDWLCYLESPLHFCDKSHMGRGYHTFSVLWDSCCQYFVGGTYIHTHRGYWSVIFFCCVMSLCGFINRVMLAS